MRKPLLSLILAFASAGPLWAQVAVRGGTVYTMTGPPIQDGVVLIRDGTIAAVGPAAEVTVPAGVRTLSAAIVTPGLIDAHSVVGLSGYLNQTEDQEQLDRSAPIQPHLRAVDAYDARELLVDWVRSFGVTTMHTGHAPGALVSGQTMIVKTRGDTVDEALVSPAAMMAATLGNAARGEDGASPGTRAKMVAMLRAKLVEARAYREKLATADEDAPPARSLELEAFGRVLAGEMSLLVTVHRSHDIMTAIRLAQEFEIPLVLDGVAEAYLVKDRILEAGYPVIVHATMQRSTGEAENLSMETAATLREAGILVALQTGFEPYVPKTRVLLFEAGVAAANGLGLEGALATVTIDAARLLGIEGRVGSLAVGKDGDVALFDGDPFEYTSHCIGTIVEGVLVSDGR